MRPSFLLIGPPRSGTTWSFRYLSNHTSVFVPDQKQIHFFDRNYYRGLDWYESFYSSVPNQTLASGDITPDYFSHPSCPERIYETFGENIKLIFIFRNPVERAISEYKMRKRIGRLEGTLEEACESDQWLVSNSLYGQNLTRYLEYFPSSCINLLCFEQLEDTPELFAENVCSCLGVNFEKYSIPTKKVNASHSDTKFNQVAKLSVSIRETIEKNSFGRKLFWQLRDKGVIAQFHKFIAQSDDEVDNQPANILYDKYFASDMELFHKLQLIHGLSNRTI